MLVLGLDGSRIPEGKYSIQGDSISHCTPVEQTVTHSEINFKGEGGGFTGNKWKFHSVDSYSTFGD